MAIERILPFEYVFTIGKRKAQPAYDLLDSKGYDFDVDISSDDRYNTLFIDREIDTETIERIKKFDIEIYKKL